ncbi:MAG: hypothetical protein JWP52_69, partial [Rhizobacter sp.]|nr:hypothetical protein [Rhizobacter sp.]
NAAARTAAGRPASATQPAARAANEPNTAPNALGARLPRGTLASLKQFQLTDAHVDLAAQRVTIGRLALSEPRARVNRFADKHWMYEQWLRAPIAASPSNATSADPKTRPQHATGAPANPTAKPWSVAVSDIAIDGGAISYADLSGAKPVRFSVSDIALGLKNFSPDATQPSPITVLARISARRGEPGTASFKGTLGLAPMAAAGQIELTRLPLHAFEPYFAAGLNVELQRADTSFIGKASFQAGPNGPTLNVAGNGQVDNFRANSNPDSASASAKTGTLDAATAAAAGASAAPDSVAQAGAARANTTTARTAAAAATRPPTTTTTTARNERPSPTGSVASTLQGDAALAEELLSWKALNLRGVAVAMKPGTRTTVDVKETALSDFFARLIVKEDGRINLQDLVKSDPAPAPAANGASAAATSTTASANAPLIRFGPISLVNGRVLFSDRFIKPNYSASLSELTGKLSAFSSASPDGQPQLADLELRGRAEGTASLEITGKLNPLAKPLALDITGKVRDLELPPLSPYSVKYAGYGIERGKMSVDVNYVVQPDGQLTAKNKLVLNQLTFGDKVEGAPNSLPVKLAVALLADRNGVIDLDLPISGSLNDPQFSLFPVILKVIGNVIVKAITSPFSLLAGAFGGGGTGGEGLDGVTFAPGSTALDGTARTTLDKVAKALTERPALKLTVTGSANVDAEREAYKRERLMQLVQAEKRRLSSDGGSSSAPKPAANVASAARASASAASAVDVSPTEYPELLKSVYKSAEISKPRNLIGLAKDLPTAEMESLLLANINVTDESIRELAVERGVAVRDYLASRELPLDRLFLGAAKAQAAPATAGTEQKFTPRAELSLATQ